MQRFFVPVIPLGLPWLSGCASTGALHDASGGHGIVYYLDGAGGGGLVTNWGRGVKRGLDEAGYTGEFRTFRWETGLGVVVDQEESVRYKKDKAAALAAKIRQDRQANPHSPIHLIGLSAGSAVVVYTLEALAGDCSVDTVVLLGASLAADYDLTAALRHVKGELYVFTSDHDEVLRMLVPVTGSADRRYVGADLAGLRGFHMPPGASAETRRLYAKVTNIAWEHEFAKDGDLGGHTGATRPRFVQHYIAPLLIPEGPRFMRVRTLTSYPS